MKTIKEVFGTSKPIIALLHFRELPGDAHFPRGGSMDAVTEQARTELKALQDGGVDGVLFSNEFSMPYQDRLTHVTTAAMAYIIGRLKDDITVPYGVHAISDPLATIDLAAAVGAQFVRHVFTGGYSGETGLRVRDPSVYTRRKRELDLDDLLMFYMINAESDGDLSGRSMDVIAKATVFKCRPDGICMSGLHAGHAADTGFLDKIREAVPGTAVFSNTGTNRENVAEKLRHCDGAFVGTTFKKDGVFENYVDGARVKAFMDEVRAFRGND